MHCSANSTHRPYRPSPPPLAATAGNMPTNAGPCEGDFGAPLLAWNAVQGSPGRDPMNQRQVGCAVG